MRDWDPGASTALHECKQALEERDIVRWLREVTRAMWRPNAERYEPSHLLDTPRGVAGPRAGNRCAAGTRGARGGAGNLRERMLAEYRAVSSPWRTRGIRLSVPHGSLLIEVGELAVHVVKAPGVQLREPEWTTFAWGATAPRHAAAARNAGTHVLPPPPIEGQLAFEFEFEVVPAGGNPVYRELFFVWAGDAIGLTAGWLGLPRLGGQRWLAVTPLWRDDAANLDPATGDVPRPSAGA